MEPDVAMLEDGPLRRTIVLQECQTLMQLQRDQRATFDNRLQSAFERITVAMQKSHEGMAAVSSTTRQILTEACEPAPQIPFSEEEEPFVPASQPSETALLQTLHMATPRASISSAMFPATLEVRRPSVSSEPDQLQPSGRSSVKDMEASESVEEYGVMRSTYETATGPVASMASPLSSKSPKTPAHMKMLMSKGTKKFEDFAQSFRAYIDYLAGAMVVLNTLCMLVQLEFEGMSRGAELGVVYAPASNYEDVFRVLGAAFVCIFLAEWLFRVAADGRQFPQDLANLFDTALIIVSLADLFLSTRPAADGTDNQGSAKSVVLLRLMRALKSLRAVRLVRSLRFFSGLRVLVKACTCFLPSLCWSMVLLGIFMIMGALMMGNLLQEFIADSSQSMEDRLWVWNRYGTAYRATYTLFEVTFAGNWPTSARPVLDKVSHLFVIFFALYITIVVFAVIRVISAIFLKETFDAAANDAEQLVRDRLKMKAEYVDKLEGVFTAIDDTGDGMITEEQLSELLMRPEIAAYFQTLDLDVHEGRSHASWSSSMESCDAKAQHELLTRLLYMQI
ncbi:unnamed protein product [Effrenium voratum]|nr:unnamed protein product [Effrenium voratum]